MSAFAIAWDFLKASGGPPDIFDVSGNLPREQPKPPTQPKTQVQGPADVDLPEDEGIFSQPEREEIHLGIIGDTDWDDEELFDDKIGEWIDIHGLPDSVVSGGDAGAHWLAARFAKDNEIPFKEHAVNPKHPKHQQEGRRNNSIVDASTHLLAFPSRYDEAIHETNDTRNAILHATKTQMPIHQHYIEDTERDDEGKTPPLKAVSYAAVNAPGAFQARSGLHGAYKRLHGKKGEQKESKNLPPGSMPGFFPDKQMARAGAKVEGIVTGKRLHGRTKRYLPKKTKQQELEEKWEDLIEEAPNIEMVSNLPIDTKPTSETAAEDTDRLLEDMAQAGSQFVPPKQPAEKAKGRKTGQSKKKIEPSPPPTKQGRTSRPGFERVSDEKDEDEDEDDDKKTNIFTYGEPLNISFQLLKEHLEQEEDEESRPFAHMSHEVFDRLGKHIIGQAMIQGWDVEAIHNDTRTLQELFTVNEANDFPREFIQYNIENATLEEWFHEVIMREQENPLTPDTMEVGPPSGLHGSSKEYSDDFQDFHMSEPMDIAYRLLKDGAFQSSRYPQETFRLTPSSDIPVGSPEDRMSRHVGMGVIPEDEGVLSQISSTPVARGDVEQMPHPKPYSAMIEEHEKQMPDTSYHYKLRPDEILRWKGHHFPKDMSFEERANMMEELQRWQEQNKELQSRSKLAGEPIDIAYRLLKEWQDPMYPAVLPPPPPMDLSGDLSPPPPPKSDESLVRDIWRNRPERKIGVPTQELDPGKTQELDPGKTQILDPGKTQILDPGKTQILDQSAAMLDRLLEVDPYLAEEQQQRSKVGVKSRAQLKAEEWFIRRKKSLRERMPHLSEEELDEELRRTQGFRGT